MNEQLRKALLAALNEPANQGEPMCVLYDVKRWASHNGDSELTIALLEFLEGCE